MSYNVEVVVASMPIKPCCSPPAGLLTGVFVGRMIADYLHCRYVMSINVLNGFKNLSRDCEGFVDSVHRAGVSVDEIWIDKAQVNVIQDSIIKMVDKGLIRVMPKRVLHCECGRVFLEEQYANNYCKLINKKNGLFYCKVCRMQCISEESEQLVFCIPEKLKPINVIPAFLSTEVNCVLQKLKGRKQIISRGRNTGCTIVVDGKQYNIDVDFAWSQLFSALPEKKQFLVASNHQIYTSAMVGSIAQLVSDKDITFVLTPYINRETVFFDMDMLNGQFYRNILYLLSCLKWKKKECNWNFEIWNKYKKCSLEKLAKCYKEILEESDSINSLLFYDFQYTRVNNRLGRI